MENKINKIKIIKNFLTEDECHFYIDYIKSNIHKFQQTKTSKRFIYLFGDELSMGGQSHIKVNLDLSMLGNLETKVRGLLSLVEDAVREKYNNEKKLFITSFSMTKQIPGSFIVPHYDTDGGINHYFKYSVIIYLNTMTKDGILNFPNLKYSYSPEAGDLLMFPSADPEMIHQVSTISEDRYSLPMWLTEDISWKIK